METLKEAQDRANRAEKALAELEQASRQELDPSQIETRHSVDGTRTEDGVDQLRRDSMMSYLLDSLEVGKDIGHYGRLVFAMVASHFIEDEDVIAWLAKDRDFGADQATAMLRQVKSRDYNPPRRERILEWQKEQEFPILPHADDPDCGNVYRSLKFPDDVYEHIQSYQVEKAEAV
jgi:hypothetical protein